MMNDCCGGMGVMMWIFMLLGITALLGLIMWIVKRGKKWIFLTVNNHEHFRQR